MAEVAALGLRVDGVEGINAATVALNNFTGAAKAASDAAGSVGAVTVKVTPGIDALTKASRDLGEASKHGKIGMDMSGRSTRDLGAAAQDAAADVGAIVPPAKRGTDALDALKTGSDEASKAVKKTGETSKEAAQGLDKMGAMAQRAAKVVASALAVRALVGYADAWSDMQSRVMVSIPAHESAADVMARLSDIARMTYSSIDQTAAAFARNATTLKALGKTTQEQLDYTEALNNALVVSGAKGEQAAMVQGALGRAMSEGALRGEELRTVLNYGSRVAEVLADKLGTTTVGLRSLGAEGKITGAVIYESLTGSMKELAAEAERMPATVGDAIAVLSNSVLQAVGVFDQQDKLTESLAGNIVKLGDAIRGLDADQLRHVAELAGLVAVAMGARLAGPVVQAGLAFLAVQARAAGAAVAVAQMGGASTAAAIRVTALTAATRGLAAAKALLGGPAGIVMIAATALTYFATRESEAERRTEALNAKVAQLGGSFEKLSAAQAKAALYDFREALAAAEETMAKAQKKADSLAEVIDTVTDRHYAAAKAEADRKGSLAGVAISAAALERELGDLTKEQDRANGAVADAADEVAKLRWQIEQLEQVANGSAKATEQAAENSKVYADMMRQMDERLLLIGKTTEAERLAARISAGYVEGLKEGEGDLLVAAQKTIDATEAKTAAEKKAKEAAIESQKQRKKAAEQAEAATRASIAGEITALTRITEINGMSADAVKIYDLAAKGATETELARAQALLDTAAAQRALAEEAQWQADTNEQAAAVIASLATEEEAIRASYDRRKGLILASTEATEAEVTEALKRLKTERDEQLLAATGDYWSQWLVAAETALTSFDELAGSVVENFSTQMGGALESVVFDFQSLGDAARGVVEAMARSLVNALGQMAAQWLAYQAIQMVAGKTAQASAAATMAANAQAMSMQAGLAAYASTAAIPITGPIMAPVAAATALAATTPVAMAIGATAMAGMAHDGIDRVPADGTWLLQKGERVTTAETSAKLDATLDRVGGATGKAAPVTVNIHNAPPGSRAQESQGPNGEQVIDVWLADFYGDGRTATAVKNRFGLAAMGR